MGVCETTYSSKKQEQTNIKLEYNDFLLTLIIINILLHDIIS